jgi:site-specific DNA-methyltransferase (adenine-specific)
MKKETSELMFSSKSDDWATPQAFYDALDRAFFFTLDPCASDENHKCDKYYTEKDDGLSKSWQGESVFVNNPYSDTKTWTAKCAAEGKKPNTTVVQLLPARTDTRYSHGEMFPNAKAILFVKGRLKFGNSKSCAPFPSMVAVYSDRGLSKWMIEQLRNLGAVMVNA